VSIPPPPSRGRASCWRISPPDRLRKDSSPLLLQVIAER
jgi:hypothetical protein